ncbi:hypothetical protein GCM10009596_10040 [Arthrobacter rhombi]|uniref:hypothetical protein n=1 Tax=Arthrobacter rhombi TaxID=71253 RepID=UPI0031D82AD7
MDNEIQLISDGEGLAVIGEPSAVDRFLAVEGLPSRDLGLQRLNHVFGASAGIAQAGSEIAANSGRWVKLTEKSAQQMKKYNMMKGSSGDVSRAIVMDDGKIKGILEFSKGAGSLVSNPAVLAGAAGIMAQVAMQQTMDEITDYLAAIDEKIDDVLRAQKDAVFADLIGVGEMIDETMTIREQVGWVSEVTWSKVQTSSMTIARTQGYALRQLDALAEKLEGKTKMGEIAKASHEAETKVQDWLAVLARSFQLQEAITILELDRVLEVSPNDVQRHREALRTARQNRLERIARSTEQLMVRMDAAAGTANARVLLHPTMSRAVVNSSNFVATGVVEFHEHLGIERGRESLDAKRWTEAAVEVRDRALETGADGVDAARQIGSDAFSRAKSATDKLSSKFTERALRRRGTEDPAEDE